jgi:hypothetical protein
MRIIKDRLGRSELVGDGELEHEVPPRFVGLQLDHNYSERIPDDVADQKKSAIYWVSKKDIEDEMGKARKEIDAQTKAMYEAIRARKIPPDFFLEWKYTIHDFYYAWEKEQKSNWPTPIPGFNMDMHMGITKEQVRNFRRGVAHYNAQLKKYLDLKQIYPSDPNVP